MIHNILVLRRTGETICSKSFVETTWNDLLTSGFISAAFNFTQMTFGAEIDDIELGDYRILFELSKDIIIVAFFNKYDSSMAVRKKLIDLKNIISDKYGNLLDGKLVNVKEFKGLEEIIENLVNEPTKTDAAEILIEKYKNILFHFRSNKEILDCDLISLSTGLPIIHKRSEEFLELCLRQMDAFWKSKSLILDQIILSYEERHLILYKIDDNYVLSTLIRRNTPLGLATLLIEETTNKIKQIG